MDDKEKQLEEYKWLLSIFPTVPDLKTLEPTIQAVSMFQTVCQKFDLTDGDCIKLALSGFLAAKARSLQPDTFDEINPTIYFQVAQRLMERDYGIDKDTEDEFRQFMDRVSGNI